MFDLVDDLFNGRDIKRTFMKVLDHPWALQSDLDVLILAPLEELKTLETLCERGLKIMSLHCDDIDPRIPIDFCATLGWEFCRQEN